MLRAIKVGIEYAHATDQYRHLRWCQAQQLCTINKQGFCSHPVTGSLVVTEPIGNGLEYRKRFDIGLLGCRICTSRSERNLDIVTRLLGSLLDADASGQHDQVGQRLQNPSV